MVKWVCGGLGKGYMGLEKREIKVEERIIRCFRRFLGDFGS